MTISASLILTATTTDPSLTLSVTAGDLIVAVVGNSSKTTQASGCVSDGVNTYTQLLTNVATVAGQSAGIYATIATTTATVTIKADHTMGAAETDKLYLVVMNFSGAPASLTGITDVSGTAGNNTTAANNSATAPSITTTNAGDLIITGLMLNGSAGSTPLVDTTYNFTTSILTQTPLGSTNILSVGYQVETSTGTYAPSWTWTTARKQQSLTIALVPASGAVNASVTQVAATVTASGGTQAISAVQIASVTQSNATVTASGGTQVVATTQIASVAQSNATVTASGGTQAVASVQIVNISQLAANVTASGGTQAVSTGSVVNASVTQVAATVTASGGTQAIATVRNATVAQLSNNVIASGGTQFVTGGTGGTTKSPDLIFLVTGQEALRLANNVYLPL